MPVTSRFTSALYKHLKETYKNGPNRGIFETAWHHQKRLIELYIKEYGSGAFLNLVDKHWPEKV